MVEPDFDDLGLQREEAVKRIGAMRDLSLENGFDDEQVAE